jgi:hypothetical protein
MTLLEQLPMHTESGEALKLVFKPPDGSKVEGNFDRNSKPKVLIFLKFGSNYIISVYPNIAVAV